MSWRLCSCCYVSGVTLSWVCQVSVTTVKYSKESIDKDSAYDSRCLHIWEIRNLLKRQYWHVHKQWSREIGVVVLTLYSDQPALVSLILWAYGEVHLCILTEQNHLAHVLDAKEIQCGFHTFFPGHAYSRLRPRTRTCFSFLPNSTNIRDQPFNTAVRGSLKF